MIIKPGKELICLKLFQERFSFKTVKAYATMLSIPNTDSEGLPGVLGTKGTWPITFRGQGNEKKIKLGTREQKHSFGNREHQNRRNTLREHGNTR